MNGKKYLRAEKELKQAALGFANTVSKPGSKAGTDACERLSQAAYAYAACCEEEADR